jgi:putative membrane protein
MNKLRIASLAALVLAAQTTLAGGFLTAQEFVTRATAASRAEVEFSKLALEKSQDANVRAFAQRMVTDHGRAGAELAALANAKRLKPAELSAEQRARLDSLRQKAGKDFDAAYGRQMVEDHDEAVSLFSAAGTLDDKELAAYASKLLPTLTNHQQTAHQLIPGQ